MKLRLHKEARPHNVKWYWFTLNGANGQVVMTSETYTRRPTAMMKKIANKMADVKTFDENGKQIW